jgi:hypothetical protein
MHAWNETWVRFEVPRWGNCGAGSDGLSRLQGLFVHRVGERACMREQDLNNTSQFVDGISRSAVALAARE